MYVCGTSNSPSDPLSRSSTILALFAHLLYFELLLNRIIIIDVGEQVVAVAVAAAAVGHGLLLRAVA